MTEKQQFVKYLKSKGFSVSPVLHRLALVPHYRKTPENHHTLITHINCCLFNGCNTKPGDLGCVTLYYSGAIRYKYQRQSISAELLKKAFCPKTCKEAIRIYEEWRISKAKTLATWDTVI